MERREFVRVIAVLAATPKWLLAEQNAGAAPALPAPVPWTLGLSPQTPVPRTITPDAAGEPVLSFFTKAQMETLSRLSDFMIPRTPLTPEPSTAIHLGSSIY